ncbi:uncharacterized protein LOC127261257 [Andrographis paniculata]|uniref:uncharacterized protein LOC127261257 n=1 Tax=Andrographis paniculata TaxID=175694 RepID=UPI0021E94121|nr:uncharacterized protein LOC127261257 [Andrographis paniculata]XP_051145473.1 uncharacterized protein LOC127261257 [Andrographis paniculata]XP_051145474.1 uncharacterized protein LOC127261257 [Andrographis paniculata]XP_051145475.1 uncharacterized protein LOC127261257 [Andrographis paniculata]XP_051145477.1 uncharacterized protein LOC127261257 [Andrographis paniculata]XP_051145478.1 uncharacterized protein LOC127261257 [Andrographis paniculata]
MEKAVDLDSLLQSLDDGGDIDADADADRGLSSTGRHSRTVDEILLRHSSLSPSPPSSPSAFYATHAYRLPLRDKHDRVLPQVFGSGVIRSNSKPGAALAAAAAASRSIPTPHATAIKLRRATDTSNQRPVSDATEITAASDDFSMSPPDVASRVSECESVASPHSDSYGFSAAHDSNSQEKEKAKPGKTEFSGNTNLDFAEADSGYGFSAEDGEVAKVSINLDTPAEVVDQGQIPWVDKNEECTTVNDNYTILSESLNEQGLPTSSDAEEFAEVFGADESSENNETGGQAQELSNFVREVAESVSGDGAGSQENDFTSLMSNRSNRSNLLPSNNCLRRPLDLAEEIEKKQTYTSLHYEEGAAAQPMRLEGVQRLGTVLGYFDINSSNAITRTITSQAFRRDHGIPQVVAVHFNYIAVGMSTGMVFVVASKYTDRQVDNMDAKMIFLGAQGDISHVSVSSLCFSQQGDLLFAGYGDGHYTVWDVQKASALKVVTEHRAPVVHILYLGQDTQVTRQFNVVSGDSKGVVKLIRFTVVPWLNRISYSKSIKLLDETTSRVVCACPLPSVDAHGGMMTTFQSGSIVSSSSSMMGSVIDEGVVIFITHQSALVAKVSPSVEVYAQIPKPDGIRDGAMPYASWRCLSQSHALSTANAPAQTLDKVSLLAIAWDKKIQVAKLLKSELKLLEKWTLECAAMGLAWLGDETLAILTLDAKLHLFAKDGSLIHQTSFSVDGFHGDDLISYHIYFINALGNPEKAYHNSIAVRGTTIYMLGSEHLVVSRLLSWKERIEVLRKAGDWMGALNMAIALYDGQSHDVIDLPKNLDDIQRIVMPYLVELLHAYVSEVFSYISVASFNQNGKVDQSDEIREQYARVGGVAVEFCLHISRTDILFDDILSKFDEAHHKETFLEILEPYILKDMLGSLPPEIMQSLVEHYSKKGWLQRIERCVLHMDILSLDFNQVVRICREHGLHCALIYLFNKGLDDFRTPLEELLIVYRDTKQENASSTGYRILVYLKYCFLGLAFPPGHGNLPSARIPSLRKELLQFLLEASSAPSSWAAAKLSSTGTCANLLDLLELDTEATLDVLKCAFTDVSSSNLALSPHESENSTIERAEFQSLAQKIVDILADIVDASDSDSGSHRHSNDIKPWPSMNDVCLMYDFIAYFVACELANVSRDILCQILVYLTSEINTSDSASGRRIQILKGREKQLLSLLLVLPEAQWDAPYLLNLCEKAQFHHVCGYIHAINHRYVAAIDSYMKVTDEPIYAFSFIHHMFRQLNKEELDAFELAVLSRIPDLLKLSREGTYLLITDRFSGRTQSILSELHAYPESLFLYLKTVIEVQTSATLNLSCLEKVDAFEFPSAAKFQQHYAGVQEYLEVIKSFPQYLQNNRVTMTDEMNEVYFKLLCQFERESVLNFLETSESYRVEYCLRLCQEYRIIDAASFLLERVGEVGSALHLILSSLTENFFKLDAEIQKAFSESTVDNLDAVLKIEVVSEILDTVHACIGLCQRNSPRLEPEESEQLWFQLLDSFCEPLMNSRIDETNSEKEMFRDALDGLIDKSEYEEGCKYKWDFSKIHKGARMMRKLFSIFIKDIVDGMIGYVRFPQITSKLLSDNGSQEFGDFKLTILGMLGTYDFERRILYTAKSLVEDDTYYIMNLLRKGASHGYALHSLTCCVCNSVFTKNASDPGIQVFSCGHALHLGCELPDSDISFKGTIVECPICVPRKKAQRSGGKSTHIDNGLLSRSGVRIHQARGSPGLYPHDYEGADSSYGSHQSSRFELLHNLEKNQKLIQIESVNQLRLAPPALYHEKVKKGTDIFAGKNKIASTSEKLSRQLKDVKVKGSSVRFPLKSSIFGKEKIKKR